MAETKEYFVKGSYMEHSKHANLILQRASTNTLLSIERQRKLVLANLMRQKRLVQNELYSRRDAPVALSFCKRGRDVDPKMPLSRQETRSATLRREAIALGNNAPGSLSVHRFGPQAKRSEALIKPIIVKTDDPDWPDQEETAKPAHPAKTVDLLFEGLTISRRTQESLKKIEEREKERKQSTQHSVDEKPRSAAKPRSSKIVSFQESKNRTYLLYDKTAVQTSKTRVQFADTNKLKNYQPRDQHRAVKSAYPPRPICRLYAPPNRRKIPVSIPSFPSEMRHRPFVPPCSPWAVHRYDGRLHHRTSLITESKQATPESSRPKSPSGLVDPWAAYEFHSVNEQNPSVDGPPGRQDHRPRKEETILHLRKVDQSRENKTVLSKVERFLERNWSGGIVKRGIEDEDSFESDVIDDKEDQMMQMSRRRRCEVGYRHTGDSVL